MGKGKTRCPWRPRKEHDIPLLKVQISRSTIYVIYVIYVDILPKYKQSRISFVCLPRWIHDRNEESLDG